uniref:DUF4430 domain-containing protein n=1 Tax=uncultured Allobacillus sp. TaxID=1638025 RepID=UPI0025950BA2|nr:DUF4430 domain-containing protein [uncultured Allobacillus sp.]
MRSMCKRLIFPMLLVLLFLLAACGSAPISKEEANELKQADEVSQVEESSLDEIDKDLGSTLTESVSATQVSKKNAATEKSDESSSDQSEESASQAENDESNESDSSPEDHVAQQDQSSESIKTTKAENTKTESKTRKNTDSSKQKSKPKEKNDEPADKSTSSKSSKKDDPGKKDPSSESNKNNEEEKEKSDQPSNKPKEEEPNTETKSDQTIVHSIVISDSEIPLPPTEMEIEEGYTVLDALIQITKAHKIQMDYRGGQGATAYVEGMANVYEFDRGSGSGWMYRVNGIFPDRGAGVVPLRPGDRVEWLYTTNLGKDLGADLKPFRR